LLHLFLAHNRKRGDILQITESQIAFIKDTLPFWQQIGDQERLDILKAMILKKYRKGENLHNGSEDCAGLIIVQSGQIRAFILSQTGKEITLYRLFERDICVFSASCIMKNINFDIFVEAEADCEVLLIPTSVYKRLSQNYLAVADFTNQLMSARFSDVMWIMEQVLFMSFDERLAIFLLEQSAIDSSDTLEITHEKIARHLGSAREVVSRMLKYFQEEGLVSLFRGGLKIIDRRKLGSLIRQQ